jgi:hypothetical protein
MKSIFIATPAFDGRVHIPYALSFADTSVALKQAGYEVKSYLVGSGSLLVAERNRIIQTFWDSNCDYMLCIDSDLGWATQGVLEMLKQDKEFMCGIYPARGTDGKTFIFRPALNKDGSIIQEKHLLKMEYIPAGFMLIKRSVIVKMRDKFPELYYEPKDPRNNPEPGYAFFNTEIYEGEFWGEDFVFCRRAREAGVEIWCDPLIEFDHAGSRGMLTSALVNMDEQENTNQPVLSVAA